MSRPSEVGSSHMGILGRSKARPASPSTRHPPASRVVAVNVRLFGQLGPFTTGSSERPTLGRVVMSRPSAVTAARRLGWQRETNRPSLSAAEQSVRLSGPALPCAGWPGQGRHPRRLPAGQHDPMVIAAWGAGQGRLPQLGGMEVSCWRTVTELTHSLVSA